MRIKPAEACLLTAVAITLNGACALVANLSQFDNATAAGSPDASPPVMDSDTSELGANALGEGGDVAEADRGDGGDAGDGPNGGDGADGAADALAGNIIQNPGFELGITPWGTFTDGNNVAILSVSSLYAHSGSFSGLVTSRTKSFQGTAQEIVQAVIQGHTYAVSAWAMIGPADGSSAATQPVDVTAAVSCMVDGATAQNFIHVGSATASSSAWTEILGMLAVPTCTMTSLQIYVEGPAPGVDLYVDDFNALP
jgi:Carbohydrate binding domain